MRTKNDLNPNIKINGNGQHSEVCIEFRKRIVIEVSLYSDISEICGKTLCSFRPPITLDDLGSIAKTMIEQLPEHHSENLEQPDIRLLLSELQKVIEKNDLSGDDKIIALLGIIILAESAKKPKEETSKKGSIESDYYSQKNNSTAPAEISGNLVNSLARLGLLNPSHRIWEHTPLLGSDC